MIDVLVCVGVCVCIQPKRLIKLEKIRINGIKVEIEFWNYFEVFW